jgi:hypothetical protein
MTAAGTAQLKVHSDPKHLPLPAAAGVGFFQFQQVPYPNIHASASCLPTAFPLMFLYYNVFSPAIQVVPTHIVTYPKKQRNLRERIW